MRGVDPGAAAEAGEGVAGHGGGVVGGVGGEVDDDFRGGAGAEVLALGLAGDVGEEHGVGDLPDDFDGGLLAGGVALDVFGESSGGVEHVLQALALGGVFFGSEGAAVALDEAGYGTIF